MDKNKRLGLRFGPYITPVVVLGSVVECEVRGLVTVLGMSQGPINWPIGEQNGQSNLIVFKALARALRQERPEAVASAWGVGLATVEFWQSKCRHPRKRKKQTQSSPPIAWKATDDELVMTLSLAEAARLTGRTMAAVRKRRRALGLPDARRAAQKAERASDHHNHTEQVRKQVRARIDELATSIGELNRTLRQSRVTAAFWRGQVIGGDANLSCSATSWR